MQKLTLYDFVKNTINDKFEEKVNLVDKRWTLNSYYKAVETPTSKMKKHKSQIDYIFLLLSKNGYLKLQGFGIYKIKKSVPLTVSSHQLRKNYSK